MPDGSRRHRGSPNRATIDDGAALCRPRVGPEHEHLLTEQKAAQRAPQFFRESGSVFEPIFVCDDGFDARAARRYGLGAVFEPKQIGETALDSVAPQQRVGDLVRIADRQDVARVGAELVEDGIPQREQARGARVLRHPGPFGASDLTAHDAGELRAQGCDCIVLPPPVGEGIRRRRHAPRTSERLEDAVVERHERAGFEVATLIELVRWKKIVAQRSAQLAENRGQQRCSRAMHPDNKNNRARHHPHWVRVTGSRRLLETREREGAESIQR